MSAPDRIYAGTIETDFLRSVRVWSDDPGIGTDDKPAGYLLSTPARELADEMVKALEGAVSAVEWGARRMETLGQSQLMEEWAAEYRAILAKLEESK